MCSLQSLYAKVMLTGLPLVVVVEVILFVWLVVFVWTVVDVVSKIISIVGVPIVVVFGRDAWVCLQNLKSLAICVKKILHSPRS
jgi:hypothetical protein